MKKSILILLVMVFALGTCGSAGTLEEMLGNWYAPDSEENPESTTMVEIYQAENSKINGKFVWVKKPLYDQAVIDEHKDAPGAGLMKLDEPLIDPWNPDERLRTRKIIGMDFIYGFEFKAGEGKCVNGKIYNPTDGKTYFASMKLTDRGKNYIYALQSMHGD